MLAEVTDTLGNRQAIGCGYVLSVKPHFKTPKGKYVTSVLVRTSSLVRPDGTKLTESAAINTYKNGFNDDLYNMASELMIGDRVFFVGKVIMHNDKETATQKKSIMIDLLYVQTSRRGHTRCDVGKEIPDNPADEGFDF